MFSFLSNSNKLDQHDNGDTIKNILAVLMISVVNADKKTTKDEQLKVLSFYKSEFGMSEEETITLFNSASSNEEEFNLSLMELKNLLSNDIQTKAKVLGHLNTLIICDGCVDEEYDLFEGIREYLI